jgi:hypothetical protein
MSAIVMKKKEFEVYLGQVIKDVNNMVINPGGYDWTNVIGVMVRYYRIHATASLATEMQNKVVVYMDGTEEVADLVFVKQIEKEGPVDELFAINFRSWATQQIDPYFDRDIHEESIRSTILRDCCERHLIRLLSADARIDVRMPDCPLYRFANNPFKNRLRNQVLIEEVTPPSDCRALVPVDHDEVALVVRDRDPLPPTTEKSPHIKFEGILKGYGTIELNSSEI